MSTPSTTISEGQQLPAFTAFRLQISRRYQKLLDSTTPHTIPRWIGSVVLFILYLVRVWFAGGWYIITYALGIYMLNLLIGFLSPKVDPEMDSEGASLPTRSDDEFRPFIRRLPEFKFWYSLTRALLFSIVCTFFSFLNIPVFWPILLLYFLALFVVTMKNQIKHMIRFRYIPFSFGKKVYKGRKDAK